MASGTAYRPREPARDVLNLYPSEYWAGTRPTKLYKAPPTHVQSTNEEAHPGSVLDRLPLEVQHDIFLYLDLDSLGVLRRVNKTSRIVLEAFPQYAILRRHATDTLRVMHTTRCTAHFPIDWLFKELCRPRCRTCSDFGPFLYLPTISRCCLECSMSRLEYRVAPVHHAMFRFGIPRKALKSLPIIHPIPDTYSTWARGKDRMVDVAQAKALGIRLHGNVKRMKEGLRARLADRNERMRAVQKKSKMGHQVTEPRYRRPILNLLNNDAALLWLNLGTTAIPYWDRQNGTIEPGAYCRACKHEYETRPGHGTACQPWYDRSIIRKAYDRAFLPTDLPEHFSQSPAVRKHKTFYVRPTGGVDWTWPHVRPGIDFLVDAKGVEARIDAQSCTDLRKQLFDRLSGRKLRRPTA